MSKVRIQLTEPNKTINKQISIIGKRVFYITINKKTNQKKIKWSKIISRHGKLGSFIAKFKKQISPSLINSAVFITFLPYTN
jgi:ribosomal protein L35AE/L33A